MKVAVLISLAIVLCGAHPRKAETSQQPAGFKAVLEEMLSLLPVDQMKKVLHEKLEEDFYLQLAFRKINSDEFDGVVQALDENDAYVDMKDQLRELGVNIGGIFDFVGKLFSP